MRNGNYVPRTFEIFSLRLMAASQVTMEESHNLEQERSIGPENGRALFIIDAGTPQRVIDRALSYALEKRIHLWVIYTAKPTLLSESKTEREVDYEFISQLEKGRAILKSISSQANTLGIGRLETSFIWANSALELVNNNKEPLDFVIHLPTY